MSEDQITHDSEHPAPGRRLRSTLVAAGAALGMTLAGLGVAQAQTDDAPADPPPPAEAKPEAAPGERRHPGGPGLRGKGGRHMAHGMGIRGEAVTRKPGGGFQTIAHQVGTVTAVSPTSITVKSEDDFSRTYAVNDDTLVNAGNEGIGDVAVGDQVRVLAIVEGGNARAVDVHDGTRVRELRERWRPGPRAPEGGTGA